MRSIPPEKAIVNDDEVRATVQSWLSILDQSSYYELLGILEIADDSAIQKAFHDFSQSFHPDAHRKRSPQIRDAVTRIYRRGAEAYGVLRDPKTRAAYDLALSQGALRLNRGKASSPATDQSASLDGACRTPAGKLHARQAERALRDKDSDLAFSFLRKAQGAEGDNPELEERFRQLFEVSKTLL